MHARRSRPFVATVVILLVAWAYGLVVSLSDLLWAGAPRWPWAALAALLPLLAAARPSHAGPTSSARLLAAARLGSLAVIVVPLLLLDASSVCFLDLPMATRQSGRALAFLCLGLFFAATAQVFVSIVVGLARGRRPWRATPWLAWGAVVVGASLSVAATQRLRQHPTSYLETLPQVGQLAPVGFLEKDEINDLSNGDSPLQLVRRCNAVSCWYGFQAPGAPPQATPDHQLPNTTVQLFHDAPNHRLFLHAAPATIVLREPASADDPPLKLASLTPSLAPPAYWVASAVGGLVAGLALLARGLRWKRLRGALRHARDGHARAGMLVMNDGGDDLLLPRALGPLRNDAPLTMLHGEAHDYRQQGAAREVIRGSKAKNLRRASARVRWHQAMAAAVVGLTAAPLVAARWLGLF